MSDSEVQVVPSEKPSIVEYFEQYLPFNLPRLQLPKTAKNLDKAVARLVEGKSLQMASRMRCQTREAEAKSGARVAQIVAGSASLVERIESGDHHMEQRAIEAAFGEAIGSQLNREHILKHAAEDLLQNPPTVDSEIDLDEDWLNTFATYAAQKSNEDVQHLWGRILAGEIRNPRSINLKSLAQLAALDSDDARFVQGYLNLVIDESWIYSGAENNFVSLVDGLRLEELGIVAGSAGVLAMNIDFKPGASNQHLFMGQWALAISRSDGIDSRVSFTALILTSFGKYLAGIVSRSRPPKDYIIGLAKPLQEQGATIELVALGSKLSDGKKWSVVGREPVE